MAKKPEPVDPRKHYAAVGLKRGSVQQDSDWNSGRRRRGAPRAVLLAAGGVVLVAVAVGSLLLARRFGPLVAFRTMRGPVANIVLPAQGSVVSLHSTVGVSGEGTSVEGIRELQLWVNGQQWASKTFDLPLDQASATWPWTPSGEGEHLLVVKAISATGATAESETVHVLAAMAADVRFPAAYNVQPGDNLQGLAQTFQTSVDSIVGSNPGLDPSAPLTPGQPLTLPIPIPVTEAQPEGGFDPAPPAGEAKPEPGATLSQAAGDFLQALGPDIPVAWHDFQISNGVLKPTQPVEKIFLYVSVDNSHWQRIPGDEHDYLFPAGGAFDLKPLLKPLLAQAKGPLQLAMEVWAWRDGGLVFLGKFYGQLSDGPVLLPSNSTDLEAVEYTYLGIDHYTKAFALTSGQLSTPREFHWTTNVPGVTYGLWQVSVLPFLPNTSLNPPGLIHHGVSYVGDGTFSLNFHDYFVPSGEGDGGLVGDLGDFIEQGFNTLTGNPPPTQTFNFWQPRFFLVRVIPMSGSPLAGDPAAAVAGPPSTPVFVYYKPFGNPYKPNLDPHGPVYEATILSFEPFRPADPKYATCSVSNYEVRNCSGIVQGQTIVSSNQVGQPIGPSGAVLTEAQYQKCSVMIPKGSPSCGCPGVTCSSSDDGCGWNPACYLGKGLEAAGGLLQQAYDFFSGLYNKAVAFVKEWAAKLNPLCIQAKLAAQHFGGENVTEQDVSDVCQAATDIAVTAVQIYFGLPPSLPSYDEFMDEGLDYAISMTATQMGIDCNPQCVALLKKGFQAATSGENLYQEGLDVGASMAADRLGPGCNLKCRQIIHDGMQGKAPSAGQLADAALDQSAKQIAANLNAQGIPCDAACENNIAIGLKEGSAVGQTAAQAAAQPKPYLPYVPHPLAADQPAVVRVKLFRRFESANVPAEDLAHCDLQIFSYETNTVNGTPIEGDPFAGQAVELPILKPGQSVTIPIVLERGVVNLPEEVNNFLAQQAQAGAPPPSSDPNVVYATYIDPWGALYYGGTLRITATGPAFLTSAAPGQGLPCVAEDTLDTIISKP